MNEQIVNSLPQANRSGSAFAVLARLDAVSVWTFLVQPAEITFDRNNSYQQTNNVGTMPNLQYGNTENWQIAINGLPLSAIAQDKSLESYVNSLSSLQEVVSGKFSPPVLMLKWGNRTLSPLVMTRFSKVETFWTPNGDLLQCKVSFGLTQVPQDQVIQ